MKNNNKHEQIETQRLMDEEVRSLIDSAYKKAKEMLADKKAGLER